MKSVFKTTCFVFGIGILYCIVSTAIMLLTMSLLHLFLSQIISLAISILITVFIVLFVTIYIDKINEER